MDPLKHFKNSAISEGRHSVDVTLYFTILLKGREFSFQFIHRLWEDCEVLKWGKLWQILTIKNLLIQIKQYTICIHVNTKFIE